MRLLYCLLIVVVVGEAAWAECCARMLCKRGRESLEDERKRRTNRLAQWRD